MQKGKTEGGGDLPQATAGERRGRDTQRGAQCPSRFSMAASDTQGRWAQQHVCVPANTVPSTQEVLDRCKRPSPSSQRCVPARPLQSRMEEQHPWWQCFENWEVTAVTEITLLCMWTCVAGGEGPLGQAALTPNGNNPSAAST